MIWGKHPYLLILQSQAQWQHLYRRHGSSLALLTMPSWMDLEHISQLISAGTTVGVRLSNSTASLTEDVGLPGIFYHLLPSFTLKGFLFSLISNQNVGRCLMCLVGIPSFSLAFLPKALQPSAIPWAQQYRGGARWNTRHVSGTDGHLGCKHDVICSNTFENACLLHE